MLEDAQHLCGTSAVLSLGGVTRTRFLDQGEHFGPSGQNSRILGGRLQDLSSIHELERHEGFWGRSEGSAGF